MNINQETLLVSPYCAAYVEAMPDRRAVAKVKRDFRRDGTCPTSAIFPTKESIEAFYQEYPEARKPS